MKLEPKARPVQISKLNLGGNDIKSLQDLIENFYVYEIIRLGEKFYTWLRRHDAEKAQQVKSITENQSTKDDEKARMLIKVLMPGYQKIELNNLPEIWLKDKNISQQAKNSFMKCYEQNIQIAIELLSKDIPYVILENFLVECESCEETDKLYPEFCYQYGLSLKEQDIDKSYFWVNKASERGHMEATQKLSDYVLETPDSVLMLYSSLKALIFRIGERKIKMVRVSTPEETFFIAEDIIPSEIFKLYYSFLWDWDNQTLSTCEYLISKFNEFTKVLPPEIEDATWAFPTIKQWQEANALNVLRMPSRYGLEWTCSCSNPFGWIYSVFPDYYKNHVDVISYDRSETIYYPEKYNYLRPVINIKMKKS